MSVSQEQIYLYIAKFFSGAFVMTPILGGRNNRAYHVKSEGKDFFVKHYNKKTQANQSRLQTEYAFLSYAKLCKSSHVAQPIACNEELSLGVYQYIPGKPFQKITQNDIDEALLFLKKINQFRDADYAAKLPLASEACFSIQEHIHYVSTRLQILNTIQVIDQIDKDVINFIREEVSPYYVFIKNNILSDVKRHKLSIYSILPPSDRIISPSDFGFHNAIRTENGLIKFVDFEYAGWDDPVKLIGDFFNQIAIPISLEYLDHFIQKIADLVENKQTMLQRAKLLMPLYGIKWICIVLNYFISQRRQEKDFVKPVTDADRNAQLIKARKILYYLKNAKTTEVNHV